MDGVTLADQSPAVVLGVVEPEVGIDCIEVATEPLDGAMCGVGAEITIRLALEVHIVNE